MNILFVLGGLRIGGYEILTVQMANALVSRGNHVGILSLSADSEISERLHADVEAQSIRRRSKFDLPFLYRISNALRSFSPDVVVCCAFYPYFVVRIASMFCLRKIPFVLAFHVTEPFNDKEERWNQLYSKCARFLRDNYIAIHMTQVAFYERRYGLPRDRFTIIHNGVDTARYSRQRSMETNRVFRIAHVASLKPLKDQWSLLKSVVEFDKSFKNWELVIAGADHTGILRNYRDFVTKSALSDKIKFVGAVTDTRGILEIADVFVLTSLTEALPISVIEAISMGLPCIVTDVGGNSDIIEHCKEGFLVKPRDYKAIAKYLRFLAENKAKRTEMGIAAREKALREFDFNTMIERYIGLFNSLSSN
jgi:glycosyltransferase involved in cell wall biosynthesis